MPALEQLAKYQRRKLLRLNQELTNQQLAAILREAANDSEQMALRVGNMTGLGAQTRAAQLRIAARGAQEISAGLWDRAGKEIRANIFASVDLAVNHMMDLDALLGMPVSSILGYAEGMQASAARTAEAIIARRRYGYTLSERVYRNRVLATGRIHRVIESGLVRRLSAREMAREVRSLINPRTPGGVSYAAMRLARTEINNSYHGAAREHMRSRPWVDKVGWELSGSHPSPDICDDFKQAGPYLPREVPDKPHPHCLCYTIPVTPEPDEFVDNLLSGQYNEWLEEQDLAPMVEITRRTDPTVERFVLRQRRGGRDWWEISR